MGHHPHGVARYSASFQRLMERVVQGLPNILVYIDNLLLHSSSHEEHLCQLDHLLVWLRQHDIKINIPKCEFESKEVAYLGFRLTEARILPCADKLQEVWKTRPPTTVQQVRQGLGLCNFIWNHVWTFAQMTDPLTELMKKDGREGPLPDQHSKPSKN